MVEWETVGTGFNSGHLNEGGGKNSHVSLNISRLTSAWLTIFPIIYLEVDLFFNHLKTGCDIINLVF